MPDSSVGQSVCPWCSERVAIKDGRMKQHFPSYLDHWAPRPCPCSDLTPVEAQDKTDESIIHHAATGE